MFQYTLYPYVGISVPRRVSMFLVVSSLLSISVSMSLCFDMSVCLTMSRKNFTVPISLRLNAYVCFYASPHVRVSSLSVCLFVALRVSMSLYLKVSSCLFMSMSLTHELCLAAGHKYAVELALVCAPGLFAGLVQRLQRGVKKTGFMVCGLCSESRCYSLRDVAPASAGEERIVSPCLCLSLLSPLLFVMAFDDKKRYCDTTNTITYQGL